MRVLFEPEFPGPMPEHRYFFLYKLAVLTCIITKKRHFCMEKSKCNALSREQVWHCSKGVISPARLSQNELNKRKRVEDKVKKLDRFDFRQSLIN